MLPHDADDKLAILHHIEEEKGQKKKNNSNISTPF